MKKYALLIIVLWFSILTSKAQVVVTAHADTLRTLIGQPVNVVIKLSQPKAQPVDWYDTDSLGQLEVLSRSNPDTLTTTDPNMLLRSQTYVVTAYDSGIYTFPSFSFPYKVKGDDKIYYADTDPLQIEVFLVPVDTTKAIKDILPIKDVPFDWTLVYWILFGLVVLGVIIYFVHRYLQKLKKRDAEKVPEVIIPIVPPHIIALEALDLLEKEKLWQQGMVKEYQTSLTDIIRIYIHDRWGVNAMEFTSDEILQHGFMNLIPQEQKEKLAYILRVADLVKFAKSSPMAQEHENGMLMARQFVEETKLKEHSKSLDELNKEVKS
ncbi:hypothetical protein BH11BAC2_BH11BAC2_21410 [soil metagenome]